MKHQIKGHLSWLLLPPFHKQSSELSYIWQLMWRWNPFLSCNRGPGYKNIHKVQCREPAVTLLPSLLWACVSQSGVHFQYSRAVLALSCCQVAGIPVRTKGWVNEAWMCPPQNNSFLGTGFPLHVITQLLGLSLRSQSFNMFTLLLSASALHFSQNTNSKSSWHPDDFAS